MRYLKTAIGLAGCAIAVPAAAQQPVQYRVEANSTRSIDLSLCSSEVRVTANGDDDTDLDFWIYDNNGRLVHSDLDGTDLTFATLRPQTSRGCINYTLRVKNLGTVYNTLSLTLEDRGTAVAAATQDRSNRRVAIHNHTAETFTIVRYANTADSDLGPDRLGSNEVQRARTNRTFNIDDGTGACRFNIQVETASGRKYRKNNVDVCSVSMVDFGTEVSH